MHLKHCLASLLLVTLLHMPSLAQNYFVRTDGTLIKPISEVKITSSFSSFKMRYRFGANPIMKIEDIHTVAYVVIDGKRDDYNPLNKGVFEPDVPAPAPVINGPATMSVVAAPNPALAATISTDMIYLHNGRSVAATVTEIDQLR